MNKRSAWHWMPPIGLLCLHVILLPRLPFHNFKLGLHWVCYLILFVFLCCLSEVKQLFLGLKSGLQRPSFIKKAVIGFFISFGIAMLMLYFFSTEIAPMYRLWQPLDTSWLPLWILAYVVLQPLVDNILYHKWLIGTAAPESARFLLLLVVVVRTYVETGILIVNKNAPIPDNGFLALVFFAISVVFVLFYYQTKNEALTFLIELLYRVALVTAVLTGMPQLLPFIG